MRAFAWFLGLILVGLAAIAALTYPAWLLLHPHFDFPFHRIGDRIGMLALAIGFLLIARGRGLDDRVSLGYGIPRTAFLRELSVGLAWGVVTLSVLVAVMTALGLLDWSRAAGLTAAALTRIIALRLTSGLAVAFIEETFLRGAMFTGIQRESGTQAALWLTALVYSATHFFASYRIAADQVSAHSGLDLLAGTLHSFAHPLEIADAFLCLGVIGLVLGTIRAVTGNIAAGIGIHAGWVWVMLVVHEMTQPVRSTPLSFLVSRFDGFVGWLVLAGTAVTGWGLREFYRRRTALAHAATAAGTAPGTAATVPIPPARVTPANLPAAAGAANATAAATALLPSQAANPNAIIVANATIPAVTADRAAPADPAAPYVSGANTSSR